MTVAWLRSRRIPQRHEGGRQDRKDRFAALIGAGVAGLQDAPFGPLCPTVVWISITLEKLMVSPASTGLIQRRSRKPGDGPQTAIFSPRAAASFDLALAVGDQQLHADRTDMPARGGQTAEQRLASRLLVEMKALRIELRGEFLDRFRGEGERAELTPPRRFPVSSKKCIAAASRRGVGAPAHDDRRQHLAQRCAGRVAHHALEGHDAGLGAALRDARLVTSISSVRSSPGRSGASQRISLTPGEPSEAVRPMKPSNIIRIRIEHRCQPEPESPFSIEALGGRFVQMHRLRIEFRGKGQDLLARDMARSERAEMAGFEIFEGQHCHD